MTAASARGWSLDKGAARAILDAFDIVLPQDDASAARLAMLGGHVTGRLNLKRVGSPLVCDEVELERLKRAIGRRRVILAASTHEGEESLVAQAVRALSGNPLMIVVPRHPERGGAVARELAAARSVVARRSAGAATTRKAMAETDVYVADTLGEIGLFYRLANAVVMGGGWADGVGGHNPLEAARLGRPIISGPHVANHADVYLEMAEAGAAAIATDGEALAAILAAPRTVAALGPKAAAFAEAQAGGFEAGWRVLAPHLPES
jgi:3-deoxy-D-manno-octulosonic-acid transferase